MSKIIFPPSNAVREPSLRQERGATMVEFALVTILLFMMIGIMVDGGVAIWRYSILTDRWNEVVVDRSIHLDQEWGFAADYGVACGCGGPAIADCSADLVYARINELTSISRGDISTDLIRLSFPDHNLGSLEMSVTWDAGCWFCPLIGLDTLTISTSGTSPIQGNKESAEARCPGQYFSS